MHRAVLAVLLLASLASLDAAPAPGKPRREIQDQSARTFLRLLQNGDAQAVAQALAYPSSYSPAQLENDLQAVSGALEALFSELGQVSRVAPALDPVQFYEVGVGTGPRPFWWQQTEPPARTEQYIYKVDFSDAGPGFARIVTRVARGVEQPVAVFLGLPVEQPESKRRVEAAYQAFLDNAGLPQDHPARTQPARVWQSKPNSQQ